MEIIRFEAKVWWNLFDSSEITYKESQGVKKHPKSPITLSKWIANSRNWHNSSRRELLVVIKMVVNMINYKRGKAI